MADLLIHEHKKNDAGSYDNVYRKTKAKIVEYTPIPEGNIDKTNVEEALQQVDTYATGMLELINNHIGSKNNPHGVTAEQVGARPNTWTPNASDVGADPVGSSAAVQGNLDTHIQNKQNPHSVTADQIGAAKPGYVFYITLLASNWVDNSQTVSDIGFVTSGYAYLINPSDEDFISWNDCIVRGKDVEQAGKMNFICEEQPSSDIVVKIVRMEVSA